jgi:multimeric flavodoxin WrbA
MTEDPDIMVLFGSPRHNGYTARMLDCFFSRWNATKEHTVIFDAYRLNIKPCVHCGYCKKTRGCCYDDFNAIDRALQTSDLLIVASPVYGLGFPAPLKAIFDRAQQYFEAKFSLGIQTPVQKRKAALFFTSYGSTDDSGVTMMKKQLELEFRVMNAELIQTVTSPNTDNDQNFDKNIMYTVMNKAVQNVRRYFRHDVS